MKRIFRPKTKLVKWFVIGWGAISLCLLMLITAQYIRHYNEEKRVDDFLKRHALSGKEGSIERAIAISDLVRSSFNSDSKNWKYINQVDEPFLGLSCSDLLEWREGNCGKATRVLIKLLHHQGYDACRVDLHGKGFSNQVSHTLVSVMINGEEYFVDTVKSPEGMNDYLRNHQVNAESFGISYYKDRNRNNAAAIDTSSVLNRRLLVYSYESIPYTKLSSLAGFNMRVLNFSRPSSFMSYLAESIYLVNTVLTGFLLLAWMIVGFLILKKMNQ